MAALPLALEHQPYSTIVLEEIWSAQTIVLEDYGLHVLNCKTLQFKAAVFY